MEDTSITTENNHPIQIEGSEVGTAAQEAIEAAEAVGKKYVELVDDVTEDAPILPEVPPVVIAEPEHVAPEPGIPIETPLPVPEAPKAGKKRCTRTFALSHEEDAYLEAVLAERQKAGLSENMNQMMRQAINNALNYEAGWQIGVPKNIKKIYLVK